MPEFVLDTAGRVTLPGHPVAGRTAFEPMTWCDLDDFTQGYIEALFFTDSGPEDGQLGDAGFSDLAPETLARIITDCARFLADLPRDGAGRTWLDLAADYAPHHYDLAQAGRDFWFTRCGHGVGFWDRGLGEIGDRLTAHCQPFGNVDSYLGDDGKVYLA